MIYWIKFYWEYRKQAGYYSTFKRIIMLAIIKNIYEAIKEKVDEYFINNY